MHIYACAHMRVYNAMHTHVVALSPEEGVEPVLMWSEDERGEARACTVYVCICVYVLACMFLCVTVHTCVYAIDVRLYGACMPGIMTHIGAHIHVHIHIHTGIHFGII